MAKVSTNQQLTDWVSTYSDALFAFAFKRLNDRSLSKDLIQDTFLSAWNNIDKFKGDASVKTWLFTILKNKLIDHYRHQSNRKVIASISTQSNDAFFDATDHWQPQAYPKAWTEGTDALLENKAFFKVLWHCKEKLKSLQNSVFTMKYIDGFESEEICKELELSPSNYWILIHRAKLQLRACLEINWMEK
ncbi:MAG: sigma-70 family RNA polymerase sigma factor [Bacteroidetes bacterium]|nr:MAG: sigma-70 family RNA polymerase sigma factor [Bacteroidota bacterium]